MFSIYFVQSSNLVDFSFLFKLDTESNGVISNGVVSSEFLEKDPSGLHAGIKVQNIRKTFSTEKGNGFFVPF